MKKITFLLAMMLPFAGFAQADCASAQVVTYGDTTVDAINGDLPSPDCAAETNNATMGKWYSFTPATTGLVAVTSYIAENDLSSVDTRVHIYTGTCGSLTCYAFNDDYDLDNNLYASQVLFDATAGTTYYIAFDDEWNDGGFTFRIENVDCSDTAVPVSENFTDSPAFVTCYSEVDGNGDSISWLHQYLDLDGDLIQESFITSGVNADTDKDDWLFTPSVELTGGTTYEITYTYNAVDGDAPAAEAMDVYMLDSASPTATFQEQIDSQTGIAQSGDFTTLASAATTSTTTFTPDTTGQYNLGFHAVTPAGGTFLLLFGYTINVSLATPQFNDSHIKMFPNPVQNELNISNVNNIDSVEVYNLLGQKVASQNFTSNDVRVNMSQLTSGAYMVKVISGTETQTMKVIKQ